jgi:hypothetical protein
MTTQLEAAYTHESVIQALDHLDLSNSPGRHADARALLVLAKPAPTWQPIVNAPMDGTEVWAFNGFEQARMKWFEGGEEMPYALWVWADETLCEIDPNPDQPTHFMPLPPNPAA